MDGWTGIVRDSKETNISQHYKKWEAVEKHDNQCPEGTEYINKFDK